MRKIVNLMLVILAVVCLVGCENEQVAQPVVKKQANEVVENVSETKGVEEKEYFYHIVALVPYYVMGTTSAIMTENQIKYIIRDYATYEYEESISGFITFVDETQKDKPLVSIKVDNITITRERILK